MGEQHNSGDEDLEDKGDEAEGAKGADDTSKENDGGADDKGADSDENDDGAGNGDDDKDGGKDGKEPEKKPAVDTDEEPPTRKKNVDFIIERKAQKLAKEKNKVSEDKGGDDNDNDDDEDIAPEDAKVIDQRVNKILSPFIQKQQAEENKLEANDFVTANPQFKPYVDKVLKWAQHPSRSSLPISSIFYEVAGKDLLKIGADMEKKASDKAKETNAGGGNNRGGNGGGTKPVWEQSAEEFEAEQAKVRNKQPE